MSSACWLEEISWAGDIERRRTTRGESAVLASIHDDAEDYAGVALVRPAARKKGSRTRFEDPDLRLSVGSLSVVSLTP